MACNLFTLNGLSNQCKERNAGGVKRIYAVPYGGLGGYVNTTTDTIVPVLTGNMIYEYTLPKNTAYLTSTYDNSVNYYTNEVSITFNKQDTGKRIEYMALANTSLTMIIEDANGKYWMVGLEDSLMANGGTVESGTAMGDANKYTLTLTCISKELPYEVLESDMEDVLEIARLLNEPGISVTTIPLNTITINVGNFNAEDGNAHTVVWGDGTYTMTDGSEITKGDDILTSIEDGFLTHRYAKTSSKKMKVIGTIFDSTFSIDDIPVTDSIKTVKIDAEVEKIVQLLIFQTHITRVVIDSNSHLEMGAYALGYSGGFSINIPRGVQFTGTRRGYQLCNSNFTSITFEENPEYNEIYWGFNYILDGKGALETDLVIPEGIEAIGRTAFAVQSPYYGGQLRNLSLPSTLKRIDPWGFGYRFANNVTIEIPEGVEYIDDMAFARSFNGSGGSRGSYTIICRATTPPSAHQRAFYAVDYVAPSNCSLRVPQESISAYQAATGWSEFGSISAI